MEAFTAIVSICSKNERITYEQIKYLKNLYHIKTKVIIAILANNGYKFNFSELDLNDDAQTTVTDKVVYHYIDKYISNIVSKINNRCSIEEYDTYIKDLNEARIHKNCFNILLYPYIVKKYIPLEHRIIWTLYFNTGMKNLIYISEIKKTCNIKISLVLMAIANSMQGPTHFNIHQ